MRSESEMRMSLVIARRPRHGECTIASKLLLMLEPGAMTVAALSRKTRPVN